MLFVVIFVLLLAIGAPVLITLLGATITGFLTLPQGGAYVGLIPQKLFNGVASYNMLALPFFLLAGEIMGRGKLTEKLFDLAEILAGWSRGGLAQINTLVCVMFASLTGSAAASMAAVGSLMIPAMTQRGYPKMFVIGLTAAGAVLGPIIPPSIIMIIYGSIMGVNVGAMFAAGVLPGLLIAGLMMIANRYFAQVYSFPKNETRYTLADVRRALAKAALPMMTPVIILGGIFSGLCTPTEASALAVLYSLILTCLVLKTVQLRELPQLIISCGSMIGSVFLLVGAAAALSWFLTITQVPATFSEFLSTVTTNRQALILILTVLVLAAGTVMDTMGGVLVLCPALVPPLIAAGADPIHVGVVVSIGFAIGTVTPPFGFVLFVASSMTKETPESIARANLPFLGIQVAALFVLALVPEITLLLPRLMGFVKD
jgi:tripartite ATP-independent transporter DctM subunit